MKYDTIPSLKRGALDKIVNTSKMRPYGRIKTVKGSLWKKDIHPPKGHKNWWEDICDPISRSIMKLNFKKEINNQIWYEQKQGND